MNEKVGWQRWIAILTGFIGVLMIIQPGTDGFTIFSIFAVLGMIGFDIWDSTINFQYYFYS